ncbi:MAG TPA: crosslink repair DNA glycosylase YcaQ family protein [Lapillicoccus sp.]
MRTHELSRKQARRIAVRAQLLDDTRHTDALDVVWSLTCLQVDHTAAVAPSADLVLWSRLGSAYRPEDVERALAERRLVELDMRIRPSEDLALYRAEMAEWPGPGPLPGWQDERLAWVEANDACRVQLLDRLRASGTLVARDLPDTCAVPWRSSGWNDRRNVARLLDIMAQRGEVAVSGRRGRERLWDLADRVYPDVDIVPAEDALHLRHERLLGALGIARSREIGSAGEPAVVTGVPGVWRVDPTQLDEPFQGRTALLSPLDRLVFDRKRTAELFRFDYQLEMYKPAAKRRWGYWALPILHHDRLVGKIDATADHQAGVLRVHAVHEDVPFTAAIRSAVDDELHDLAGWLGLVARIGGR